MDTAPQPRGRSKQSPFFLETGLIFLVLAAPFFFGSVYLWASMSLSAALFFLFFLYPEACQKSSTLPLFFVLSMAFLLLYIPLQVFLTPANSFVLFCEFLKWSALAAAFLLIQLLPRWSIYKLLGAMIVLGVAETLYGFLSVRGEPEKVLWTLKEAHQGYLTGTYFNRNHFAGLLELCLGLHLGALIYQMGQKKYAFAAILFLFYFVVFFGLLQSGSRAGVLSYLLSATLWLFLIKKRRLGAWTLVILLPLTAALYWSGELLLNRFFFEAGTGIEERSAVWKSTLRMIAASPWTGFGLGHFEWAFPAYQQEGLIWGYGHAHQDYLELIALLGIPASLVLFSAWMLWGAKVSLRLSKAKNYTDRPLAAGALIGMTSLLFHGFTDFNFAIPAQSFLFVVAASSAWRLLSPKTGKPS